MPDTEPDDLTKAIEEHCGFLGHLALAWNHIAVVLGSLYVEIAHQSNPEVGFAAWNADTNDRSQRRMLDAAIKSSGLLDGYKERFAWGLGEVDKLENDRDTALHAPYTPEEIEGVIKMVAYHQSGHLRAVQLRYADLSGLFHAQSLDMLDVAQYISLITIRLQFGDESKPWPERPVLRHAKPPKSLGAQSQKTGPK